MMGESVRAIESVDFEAIALILGDAFGGDAECNLVSQLRKDGDMALERLIEVDRSIVGYIGYSTLYGQDNAVALAPLAVTGTSQRIGYGTKLMQATLAELSEAGWQSVFVVGSPNYYERFGFSAQTAKPFQSPYAGRFFQALELESGSLAGLRSSLSHSPAFGTLP